MDTLYERFQRSAFANASRTAMQWKHGGRWRSWTYRELYSRVNDLSMMLLNAGIRKGDRVAIMSENRPAWTAADLAINSIGAISVPVHTTANRAFVDHLLNHSGCRLLLISSRLYDDNKTWICSPGLEEIWAFKDSIDESAVTRHVDTNSVTTKWHLPLRDATMHDLATIIYTSGTTGEPKGVMLTNKNILSNVEATRKRVPVYKSDTFLSFLPLSHVLERTCGSYVPLMTGAQIVYAEGIKELTGNLKEIRPTVIIAVPKIFETFREKIIDKMNTKSPALRKLFNGSMNKNCSILHRCLANTLIHSRIRQTLGGHLRVAVSGGASLHRGVLDFFHAIGIGIVEGYGLTETSPVVSVNSPKDNRCGTVGQPLEGIEVKIASDGEILVKGANVMPGYYLDDYATREAFDTEGYFRTGDTGTVDKEGFITIIGRKKEIIVTSNGKNIAPAAIETRLNMSPFIAQSVLTGDGRKFVSALIVPDAGNLAKASTDGHGEWEAIIGREIDAINETLMPHERIRRFCLIGRPFSIEKGELTPTLKIKRGIVEATYIDAIEHLYRSEDVC